MDKKTTPIGVNVSKNTTTSIEKHMRLYNCMEKYEYADYLTINISSPNTKRLRKLHHEDRLSTFLEI